MPRIPPASTEWGGVTNNAVVASYEYDTFGNRTTTMGAPTASNRGFTGFYYHPASGLQFARNRAYSSSLARWMTRDPIGMDHAFDDPETFNATDLNLYAYAGNNPQSMVDPSGNEGQLIGRIIKWCGAHLPVVQDIGRVSEKEGRSLMRRGDGVVSESQQEAKRFAAKYSTIEGGPGGVEMDPGHNDGDPHYHGIGPDGDRLPGHSWWSAGVLLLLDENGNGRLDWGDIEAVDNFLPGPVFFGMSTHYDG